MNQKFLLKWTEKGPIVIETKSNIISYETIKNHVADLVDYVSYIDFGNTKYEIIVDDEGICKKLPITFIVVDKVNLKICSPLAGPCLIVKSDSEGNNLPLEFEDVIKIILHVKEVEGKYFVELDNEYVNKTNEMLMKFFASKCR
jgi:hypothetical protein